MMGVGVVTPKAAWFVLVEEGRRGVRKEGRERGGWASCYARWGHGRTTYLISMTELGLSSVEALPLATPKLAASDDGVEESLEIFRPPWLPAPPAPRLSLGLSSGGTRACAFQCKAGIGRQIAIRSMNTFEYRPGGGKGSEGGGILPY